MNYRQHRRGSGLGTSVSASIADTDYVHRLGADLGHQRGGGVGEQR